MDALEMTRLCAEVMGWKFFHSKHGHWEITDPNGNRHTVGFSSHKYDPYSGEKLPELTAGDALLEAGYDPLHNDAQCFALVKKFQLQLSAYNVANELVWEASFRLSPLSNYVWHHTEHPDLNRAVVECVAKMQQEKKHGR